MNARLSLVVVPVCGARAPGRGSLLPLRSVPEDVLGAVAVEIADAGDLEAAGMGAEIDATGPVGRC